MMRPKEPEFKEQGLSKTDSDEVLLAAMATTPKLIERPILINGERAALGRPPEKVLEII
jgi:arsenate reductase